MIAFSTDHPQTAACHQPLCLSVCRYDALHNLQLRCTKLLIRAAAFALTNYTTALAGLLESLSPPSEFWSRLSHVETPSCTYRTHAWALIVTLAHHAHLQACQCCLWWLALLLQPPAPPDSSPPWQPAPLNSSRHQTTDPVHISEHKPSAGERRYTEHPLKPSGACTAVMVDMRISPLPKLNKPRSQHGQSMKGLQQRAAGCTEGHGLAQSSSTGQAAVHMCTLKRCQGEHSADNSPLGSRCRCSPRRPGRARPGPLGAPGAGRPPALGKSGAPAWTPRAPPQPPRPPAGPPPEPLPAAASAPHTCIAQHSTQDGLASLPPSSCFVSVCPAILQARPTRWAKYLVRLKVSLSC